MVTGCESMGTLQNTSKQDWVQLVVCGSYPAGWHVAPISLSSQMSMPTAAASNGKSRLPVPVPVSDTEKPLNPSIHVAVVTKRARTRVNHARTSIHRSFSLWKRRFQDLWAKSQGGVPIEICHWAARLQRSSILPGSTRNLLSALWLPL